MAKTSSLTPMLRHYLEVKAEHPDAVLFYRMGDFYELFFEDAQMAAPILEVTLTARQKGTESEAPMCGVPHHALESYVGKLLQEGHKVAICDQVEDPKESKGLVKREVTRIMTPGTLSEPELLESHEENLLASLAVEDGIPAGAFLDVSTGRFFVRRWEDQEEAVEDLLLLRPREAIFPEEELPDAFSGWIDETGISHTALPDEHAPRGDRAERILLRQLGIGTLKGLDLEADEPAVRAAAGALEYARDTQKHDLDHVRELGVRERWDALVLDPTTLSNLEVLRNLREGGRRGSLLGVVDRTRTAAGGRMLREWLRRPLREKEGIEGRLEAVEELLIRPALRDRIRQRLAEIGDLERLTSRAVLGSLRPREAAALRSSLEEVPAVLAEVADCEAPLLAELSTTDPLGDLADDLQRTLVEEPAATLEKGGVIADGVDEELDRTRSVARDSKETILSMEAREREATDIQSLKIKFNKVFGYFLEVTKANTDKVPDHYTRKQTLVNAERYVTPEIKELEEEILSAEERQVALEEYHYGELLERIGERSSELGRLAETLATVDVLACFAEVAARGRYCRPTIGEPGGPIRVEEGRHPVVEALTSEPFVPNDVELDGDGSQIVVLTGPNMGGKSTYLRQVALIVLLAQAGSFVPATAAEIGLVDRIFTRVGASDDLARGESTFMVEMIETSRILHHATEESLVILDEVGRGTATFDGLSLAWAIVEYLHEHQCPKTLFATHYHELTELASLLSRVVNRTLTVKEWEEEIVFLRKVVPGSADRSYGIQVGRLAGLPPEVVERAQEILGNLESQEYDLKGRPRLAKGKEPDPDEQEQLQLFAPEEEVVAEAIRKVDIDRLTPVAALNLIASLKERLD
ncbi:MAG: DNA mismatch repair protein MutS [Thermoanaerobaculia bacterium]|nr:DNA mismatch repair protein MutS [Thermoanaerobaculia bacterium]